MPARTRLGLIAAVLITLAATTACWAGPPQQSPPPKTTTAEASPSTAPTGQEALDAYRAMWVSVVDAAKTADPDAPQLRRHATGDALARIVKALYLQREQDQVILGTIALTPTVDDHQTSVTDVHIVDCVDTSLWLVYRSDGGLVDDTPGGRHPTSAVVTNHNGNWMVSTLDIGGVGTC